MVDALDAMRAQGWRRAVLWVLRDNAHARAFYERGGWTPTGAEREEHIGTVPNAANSATPARSSPHPRRSCTFCGDF